MTDEIRPYGPGKFDTMLDAYVYELSLHGCDDEQGSVSETGVWYGLFRGFTVGGPFSGVPPARLNSAELDILRSSAGCILSEDSQGFVSVEYFDTTAKLDDAWAEIEAAHAADESEDA